MKPMLLLIVIALVAAAGCGSPMGLLIQPVPLKADLSESVVGEDPGWWVAEKIAVIDVDGLLTDARQHGLMSEGENPVSVFIEKIDKASKDKLVKAVVLRINSPGGGVSASDLMYRRLLKLRSDRHIPIIASCQDMAASGGYYLACGADEIYVLPTSVTGSIGVIVQTVSFAGTMGKLGIDAQAVTSGPRKDMASPLKPLDKEDLAILQSLVDEFYGRFLDVVADGRKGLDRAKIKALADGRVYTGAQALANGLADQAGTLEEAIAAARTRAGLKKARTVIYHRPLGNKPNAYAAAPAGPPQMNLLNVDLGSLSELATPQFMYLWAGRSYGR
jgi:protease IV